MFFVRRLIGRPFFYLPHALLRFLREIRIKLTPLRTCALATMGVSSTSRAHEMFRIEMLQNQFPP